MSFNKNPFRNAGSEFKTSLGRFWKNTTPLRTSVRNAGSEVEPFLIRFWKNNPLLAIALIVTLLSAIYWGIWASNRYVSEAHIFVQRTDLPSGQSMDVSGVLAGVLGGTDHTDQLMLQDYLLSVDMLKRLDAKLKLRDHYSDTSHDIWSRLWRKEMEWFLRYYQKRVEVYFDDRSGILYVRAEAYDPEMAQKIVQGLVHEGELFMNGQAHVLAGDQVRFLENQVMQMKDKALRARRAVVAYQNRNGLLSPEASAESLAGTLAQLESKRIELEAQRTALASYLVPNHPNIAQLDQQVRAIEKQIAAEKSKLTAPSGKALNLKVEEFQRLELEAGFAQEVYQTALAALERGRVEASRTIKKVSVLQIPTLPEYPEQPHRLYNMLVSALLAFLLAGIVHLIIAIVREHKD